MKIALFYPSLYSDRKNPIAHFSRGLAKELLKRGHGVEVYESQDNPALAQLVKEEGLGALEEFKIQYPELDPQFYVPGEKLEDHTILDRADLVIVHAGNPPWLVEEVGMSKKGHGFILLFHDTLHLSATDPEAMERYDLSHYDGALVQGNTVKKIYLERNWAKKVWTWHQGADVGLFKPEGGSEKQGDLVWIGNWADGQRAEELEEFLIRPVKELGIKATVHGVGYPGKVKKRFAQAGMDYGGWLPNYRVPEL